MLLGLTHIADPALYGQPCCTGKDLELIGQQYPFEPLQFQQQNLRLPFEDGIKMLQEAGYDVSYCAHLRHLSLCSDAAAC